MLIVTRGWPLPLHVGAAKLGRWGTAAGEGGAQEGYPCFWGDGSADVPWGRRWALTAECPQPGLAPRRPASPLQPPLARPAPPDSSTDPRCESQSLRSHHGK